MVLIYIHNKRKVHAYIHNLSNYPIGPPFIKVYIHNYKCFVHTYIHKCTYMHTK